MAGKTNPGRAACTDGTTTRTLTKTNAKTPASLSDIFSPKQGASGPAILICQNSSRVLPYSLPEAQSHETKTDKSTLERLSKAPTSNITPLSTGTSGELQMRETYTAPNVSDADLTPSFVRDELLRCFERHGPLGWVSGTDRAAMTQNHPRIRPNHSGLGFSSRGYNRSHSTGKPSSSVRSSPSALKSYRRVSNRSATSVRQNSPVTTASAASSISIRFTVAIGGTFLTR